MKEPQRLLTDMETSERSRSLLAAGRARREPDGARERVWSAVAVGLAGGVAATVKEGARSGRGAGGGAQVLAPAVAKVKLLVVGAMLVAAAGAGVMATMSREAPVAAAHVTSPPPFATHDSSPVSVPEVKPSPPSEPVASAEPIAVAPVVAAASKRSSPSRESVAAPAARKSTAAEHEAAPPTSTSKLREEAALLQVARAAVARGDTSVAGAKLADAKARFPDSQLVEERDALEVRVANASSDRARAASLARAFVAHYPDSPLRAGVEAIGRAAEKE